MNTRDFSPDMAFFIRQQDDYSCGPACVATVARLYGIRHDYDFFRGLLNPNPEIGTCPTVMIKQVSAHLPVASAGENTYHGGIAIANIIHQAPPDIEMDEEGHYVVYLARQEEHILYYDPYDHRLFQKPRAAIKWVSEDGAYKNWSINFKPLPGASFNMWQRFMTRMQK